jgi:hypothetical protein
LNGNFLGLEREDPVQVNIRIRKTGVCGTQNLFPLYVWATRPKTHLKAPKSRTLPTLTAFMPESVSIALSILQYECPGFSDLSDHISIRYLNTLQTL